VARSRFTGSLDRGVALRTAVADLATRLEAHIQAGAGAPDTASVREAKALLGRARELDGRLSKWGQNVTSGPGRTEDLLEFQDLSDKVRKLNL
jgi:hypothetical protein